MTDWTKLIDRLQPPADGETAAKHRTGVVDAVGLDTVDVVLSGVVVPSVPVVAGALPLVGDVVHLLVWRGDLLALGGICDCGSPGPGPSPTSPGEGGCPEGFTCIPRNSATDRLYQRPEGESVNVDDDEFADASLAGTAVTPSGTVTWTENGHRMQAVQSGGTSGDIAPRLFSLTPSSAPVTITSRMQLVSGGQEIKVAGGGLCFSDGTAVGSNTACVMFYSAGPATSQAFSINVRGGTHTATTSVTFVSYYYDRNVPIPIRWIWTAANTFKLQVAAGLDGPWIDPFGATHSITITPTHFGPFIADWDTTKKNGAAWDMVRIDELDLSV